MCVRFRGLSGNGDAVKMEADEVREAFEVPREFASAIEQLDSQQVKRSVELMGQCVQVRHGLRVEMRSGNVE